MKNLHNIEPSVFRKGEYVGYDGRGHVWHVAKRDRRWLATPAPNNPARHMGVARIQGATLSELSATLAARQPVQALEPF